MWSELNTIETKDKDLTLDSLKVLLPLVSKDVLLSVPKFWYEFPEEVFQLMMEHKILIEELYRETGRLFSKMMIGRLAKKTDYFECPLPNSMMPFEYYCRTGNVRIVSLLLSSTNRINIYPHLYHLPHTNISDSDLRSVLHRARKRRFSLVFPIRHLAKRPRVLKWLMYVQNHESVDGALELIQAKCHVESLRVFLQHSSRGVKEALEYCYLNSLDEMIKELERYVI